MTDRRVSNDLVRQPADYPKLRLSKMLRYWTAGESHGKTLLALVDGFPAGVTIDVALIDGELQRRQGGYGRGGRQRIETDRVEILTGVWKGVSLGSPDCAASGQQGLQARADGGSDASSSRAWRSGGCHEVPGVDAGHPGAGQCARNGGACGRRSSGETAAASIRHSGDGLRGRAGRNAYRSASVFVGGTTAAAGGERHLLA